jgi:hypothetical protein
VEDGTDRVACGADGKVLGTEGGNGEVAGSRSTATSPAPTSAGASSPGPGKLNTDVILNVASSKALDMHFPWELP